MNCNIIKDFLPLYMENICSSESRAMVEEHLSSCEECKKYQKSIGQEISFPKIDENKVREFLSEKDFLRKSRKSIQNDFLNKSITVVHILSIVLTIMFLTMCIIFMLSAYPLKYPGLHSYPTSGFTYIIIFMIGLCPLIIGIIGIIRARRNKSKHPVLHFVISIFLQILALILSFIIMACIFILMPPFESRTQNIDNYLFVDKNLLPYEEIYSNFFPDKIPEAANGIDYFYSQYESLFSQTATMQASWKLPEAEYLLAKNNILENTDTEPVSKEGNVLKVTLKGIRYPGKVNLEFQFNNQTNRVTYILYIDKNI